MLAIHANVYAAPEGAVVGPTAELRGLGLPTFRNESGGPPAFLETMPTTFEAVQQRLLELPSSDCEPDGFFLISGREGGVFWRLNGHMHEHDGAMHRVELRGECPERTLDAVLRTLGWPDAELVFELVREGVTLRESDFRKWAARSNRDDTSRLAAVESSRTTVALPASRDVSSRALRYTAWHITFGAYGARLHGDVRPTVDRRRNQGGEAFEPRDESRHAAHRSNLAGGPVRLTDEQRRFIEATLPAVCQRGGWRLQACAAGVDHVHVVLGVAEDTHGERVQAWMKRWLTEALDRRWPDSPQPRWWTKGGSSKAIHDAAYLANAIAYVERQRATPPS